MKAPILARKIHKWIALIVGIQALFWMLSGAFMATISIDYIHGDQLVRNLSEPLAAERSELYSIAKILERYPQSVSVDIKSRNTVPYFAVRSVDKTTLLDARTGEVMSSISREQAIELANYYYAADGDVSDVLFIANDDPKPKEVPARVLPAWQVSFSDKIKTTFYLSPSTGELVTRRHTFWRLYDFLWMFHIMDYENRSDINNNLLRFAALVGLAMALSGVWLLIHSLRGRRVADADLSASTDQLGRSYGPVPKTP